MADGRCEAVEKLLEYALQRDRDLRQRFVERFGVLPEDVFDFDSGPFIEARWNM